MAATDRTTTEAILGRARKTLWRAASYAYQSGDPQLSEEILLLAAEVGRLLRSTRGGTIPPGAAPRHCA